MSSSPSSDRGTEGSFLTVGVGASAGGLRALEEFFEGIADRPGMAFVILLHQKAGHATLLPELLARRTRLPIQLVEHGTVLSPDHVYVCPPGWLVTLDGDRFEIAEAAEPHPQGVIDRLFRSLAGARGASVVGVILSGTGSDGTVGVQAIKARLGLVIAQEPETADHDGMPRSAIESGSVDGIWAPAEIGARLAEYAARVPRSVGEDPPSDEEIVERLLELLHRDLGHDFSEYKRSTIGRRVRRRMLVNVVDDVATYLGYCRENPSELRALFHDLLIGVTQFFRDPEAFEVLANEVLPKLLDSVTDRPFRVWVAGCSTGEEAYSIAIAVRRLLAERGGGSAQIYATDIDPKSVEVARRGTYPLGIAPDVEPEVLGRYFVRQGSHYRVDTAIRELLVFAEHDVLGDPPFIHLDLLVCRNLLIYLNLQAQHRVLELFRYALRPGGVLFLGSSETVGTAVIGFEAIHTHWRMYRALPMPSGGAPAYPHTNPTLRHPVLMRQTDPGVADGIRFERMLVAAAVPPSAVVDSRGRVVYIHGRTGRWLEPAPGGPEAHITDMAREGLVDALSRALDEVVSSGVPVELPSVAVRQNGSFVATRVTVTPVTDGRRSAGHIVVSFLPARIPTDAAEPEDDDRRLLAAQQDLRSAFEELQSSNEELQSTNEELQSSNEELQSVNEELATSKEETQSLNEELQTVNSELKGKVDQLSVANDDMANLLASTGIATIYLDAELRIKRFTPQSQDIVQLIPSDVGRPLSDLVSRVDYNGLENTAREVVRRLVPVEVEVPAADGQRWYLMRVTPYRTGENVIDGVVITFIDITRFRQTPAKEQGVSSSARVDEAEE